MSRAGDGGAKACEYNGSAACMLAQTLRELEIAPDARRERKAVATKPPCGLMWRHLSIAVRTRGACLKSHRQPGTSGSRYKRGSPVFIMLRRLDAVVSVVTTRGSARTSGDCQLCARARLQQLQIRCCAALVHCPVCLLSREHGATARAFQGRDADRSVTSLRACRPSASANCAQTRIYPLQASSHAHDVNDVLILTSASMSA